MRIGNFQPLSLVFNEMIRELNMGNKLHEIQLKRIWYEQMQGIIAKHTQRIIFKDNVLYVWITSSVIKQELFMAKEKICQIMNDKMGEKLVKELVLR